MTLTDFLENIVQQFNFETDVGIALIREYLGMRPYLMESIPPGQYSGSTLVLSVGYSSPAYTAAASWRIREDWFLQQALRDERADDVDDQPVPVVHTPPVASVTAAAPIAPAAPMSAITPVPSAARTPQGSPTVTGMDEEDEGPSPGNAW